MAQQYPQEKQTWEQNQSERALIEFEKAVVCLYEKLETNEGKPLSTAEKAKIKRSLNLQLLQAKRIGDLDKRLAKFRNKDMSLTRLERQERWSIHCSTRLGKNLKLAGKPKPDNNCQAHAIIAGNDPSAASMRYMLILAGMKVDDPVNGAWLPSYEDDAPHWSMTKAVCHSWLNHNGYHQWLEFDVFGGLAEMPEEMNGPAIRSKLKSTANRLQQHASTMPSKAIKKKVTV